MKIYKGYKDLNVESGVVTIGMFDGVHRGHISLLEKVKTAATNLGVESVVLTFEPHPRIVLSGGDISLQFLTSLDEKIALLDNAGIDHLVVMPFSMEFSRLSACDFIKQVLVDGINTSHLVVGFDHQFGHRGSLGGATIDECAAKYGFSLERVGAYKENDISISSTTIRNFINDGRLSEANSLLGYDYFLKGKVIEGMRIGRGMGYPTANLKPDYDYKLIPNNGVYAVEVLFKEHIYKSMLYIGTRPTLEGSSGERSIEANLFDFDGNLYDEDITIYFRHRLRGDVKFESKEELKKQIDKDKKDTLKILG